MNNRKIFDLPALNGRRSFYGKAKIEEQPSGDKILISYNTEVAKITASGDVVRLWSGNSNTTATHFKSFCEFYGVPFVPFNKLEVAR